MQDMQTVHAKRTMNEVYQMVYIRKANLCVFSFLPGLSLVLASIELSAVACALKLIISL